MSETTLQDPPGEAVQDEKTKSNGDAVEEKQIEKSSEEKSTKKDSTFQRKDYESDRDSRSRSRSGSRSRSRSRSRDRRRDHRNGHHRGGSHRGRGRGGYMGKNKPNKNRFDPSQAEETDDPVEIRKQVEFYFSDHNLPNDKFLFQQVGGAENNAVPIKIIHGFKRMRRFQPFEAVVAALKESETLDVVDDDTAIQRKVALPEGISSQQPEIRKVYENEAMARSVYIKGFGEEKPTTQFDIEAWVIDYGVTNQVRLRRTNDGSFKGSVFVEFDNEETAKKFVALDPAPKYRDQDLQIKSKKQYCDEKVDALNAGDIRAEEPDEKDWNARRENDRRKGFPSLHKGGRGGRGDRRGKHDRDDRRDRRPRSDRDLDRDDPRDTRRKAESKEETKDDPNDKEKVETKNDDADKQEAKAEEPVESKKREREEEQENEAPAAKKANVEEKAAEE